VFVERRGDRCLILTAAHVVANSTFLQVQLAGQPEKALAEVVAVAHETDLALISVDAGLFEGVQPLCIAPADELPQLRDKVYVLGFPVGGDDLSITDGVVSRVEVQSYSHSHARALAVTVDAAVNSGNSGGPVMSERSGKVIGIAFQGYAGSDIEAQGHMVPAPLIQRFLAAAAAGRPTGLPSLGFYLQQLQAPPLRRKLQLRAGDGGVLVSGVEHGGCCDGLLREGDVVLAVDGERVASDGTCMLLGRRLSLTAAVHRRCFGDVIPLEVLRDGQALTLQVTLAPSGGLVPRGQYDLSPPYYLLAGLLFQPLSLEYLSTWGELKDAPPHLLQLHFDGVRLPSRTEVVLLTQVLADEATLGYSGDTHGCARRAAAALPAHAPQHGRGGGAQWTARRLPALLRGAPGGPDARARYALHRAGDAARRPALLGGAGRGQSRGGDGARAQALSDSRCCERGVPGPCPAGPLAGVCR